MSRFLLLDDTDVQQAFATHLRNLREAAKLSRDALAERSSVPAPTIKKFELTGQISFRQLLLLWQSLDDLNRLHELTQPQNSRATEHMPTTIDEVLKGEF
ncbi:helix-turn-helix domain-containing protein [Nitrincola sp. MINF-07-Sa-05]|uniref:helix-turn-helix domain-containing protein n=1 Tax=Nitrincola salilacus TaxID=3400273 RepID=UPI0039180781